MTLLILSGGDEGMTLRTGELNELESPTRF